MKAALIVLLVLLAACGKKENVSTGRPVIERVEDAKTACWRVNDPGMPVSPWNCESKQ